jgi:LysM repeat protein
MRRVDVIKRYAKIALAAGEHVVVSGDTFGQIAVDNEVTESALMAANPGVVPASLGLGQRLSLPDPIAPEPVAPDPSYADDLVISVLMAEARSVGGAGMRNVYTVIMNRSEFTGDSMYTLVTDRHEFSCLNGYSAPYSDFISKYKEMTDEWDVARSIFDSGRKSSGRLSTATHYYSGTTAPYWAIPAGNSCWVELGSDGGHTFGEGGRPYGDCMPT